MANIHIIIPARLKSTRLPGKMLADIAGKPMIQRVYEQARKSDITSIVIATDADEIAIVANSFCDNVIMTRQEHESGTDRLAEVVAKLNLADDDIVINVQGDEPLIPIENIHQVAELLADSPNAVVSTLCEKITCAKEVYNANNVKVVFDKNNYALYFSRASIPFERGFSENNAIDKADFYRHIGMYAYRVGFLKEYASLARSPIEAYESLEQLRVLWNGYKIAVAEAVESTPAGVDTLEDLEKIRTYF
jgi:3-deoxy-manno-octulosonate cytidylyltransferase (CMP-KDO synthetase)